jgi:epoxyqueuosine reductase
LNIIDQTYKQSIKTKAKELGFIACGFAKYEVLESEAEKLREWLDAGKQADMAWIERGFEKRKDVRHIMPEAQSVISLAFNYYTPFEHDESKPKISRYAWGKDYHKILKKKLKELSEFLIQTSPSPLLGKEGALNAQDEGVLCRAYVDDGPVMDKVWAQRAGIGWMGKHSNIINPEYGSWFFLSEIITNIDFGIYDTPIEDMCGSCSLCISACPTGAIESEYVVNANKCISYQTIENRGEIPQDLNLDGWIFGCDVCQDVCPFNSPKYNHVTEENGFWPKSIFGGADQSASTPTPMAGTALSATSQELAQLTEEQFAEVFADSPIKRTKYAGWKRNLGRIDK